MMRLEKIDKLSKKVGFKGVVIIDDLYELQSYLRTKGYDVCCYDTSYDTLYSKPYSKRYFVEVDIRISCKMYRTLQKKFSKNSKIKCLKKGLQLACKHILSRK